MDVESLGGVFGADEDRRGGCVKSPVQGVLETGGGATDTSSKVSYSDRTDGLLTLLAPFEG